MTVRPLMSIIHVGSLHIITSAPSPCPCPALTMLSGAKNLTTAGEGKSLRSAQGKTTRQGCFRPSIRHPSQRADFPELLLDFFPRVAPIHTGVDITVEAVGDNDVRVRRMRGEPIDRRIGLDREVRGCPGLSP